MNPTDPRALRMLAGSLVTLVAVGCGEPGWPENTDGFEAPTCVDGAWRPVSDVTATASHEYLAAYYYGDFIGGPNLLDGRGDPCPAGLDEEACVEATLSALGEVSESVMLTRDGDGFRRWTGRGEFLDLFGDVDTPAEALLMVWREGFGVSCNNVENSAVRPRDGGGYEVVSSELVAACAPIITDRVRHIVTEEGVITEVARQQIERSSACIGRRPPGMTSAVCGPGGAGASWLSKAAHLEACSVPAFEQLIRELRAHGAPEALVLSAQEALEDERRHAVDVGALAVRYGGRVLAAAVQPVAVRSLEAIALDNAVEGCVRETFGVIAAAWQIEHAEDAEVVRVMGPICEDEARHAALAWQIAAWIEPLLDDAARHRVEAGRREAVRALRDEVSTDLPVELTTHLGVPAGQHARDLVDAMDATLWRQAA